MLEFLGTFIINFISATGYIGIFILMALESACLPIPSEVTMPFAGSLVLLGKFELVWVVVVGALGNLAGSLLAYALGYWGEENLVLIVIKKYGKYFLMSVHEYNRAKKWFLKYGDAIVFLSRLLPVIRTFISLPAGIAKMNLKKFILYTTVGSLLWSFLLTYIGVKLGQHWSTIGVYFHKFDLLIVFAGVLAVGFYIFYKYKELKKV